MVVKDIKNKIMEHVSKINKEKWIGKKGIYVAVAGLLILFIFIFFGGSNSGSDYIEVKEQEYVEKIVAVGQLGMENQTSIISQVNGKVDYIGADEGETVSSGAVIISIYNSDQGFQTEQSKATYLDVEEQYNSLIEYDYVLAKDDFERANLIKLQEEKAYNAAQVLYNEGAISKNLLDDYQLNYQTALNQLSASKLKFQSMAPDGTKRNSLYYKLESAKSIYESNLENESKYKIKTSWDAVILGAYIKVDDTVKPGDLLLDIGQAKTYTVVTELDEKYFTYVSKGMKVDITLEGQQTATPLEGEIDIIAPKINKNTGTFRVIINLISDVQFNASDLTVNIQIVLKENKNVIVISNQYLIDGTDAVFVYRNGKAIKTEVVVERGPSSNVIIKKGLKEGDQIIFPAEGINDGTTIKLKKGVEAA